MPHVAGHSDDEPMIDYSSFEHQTFQADFFASEADQNTDVDFDLDPLASRGGLDSDQVAELVAMDIYITVAPDNLNELIGQDNAEGSYEFRGAFGSDLTLEEYEGVDIGDGQGTDVGGFTASGDAVFDQFDATAMVGFSDSAAGTGGGGTTINSRYVRNFRSMLNRGPVLDAADNLNIVGTVIKNNVAAQIEATYGGKLYWDTSTIEGDRRQFSVP